jgi:hypothetical protein
VEKQECERQWRTHIHVAQLTFARHNLTEATRDMVKTSTIDVKRLASLPAGGQYVCDGRC